MVREQDLEKLLRMKEWRLNGHSRERLVLTAAESEVYYRHDVALIFDGVRYLKSPALFALSDLELVEARAQTSFESPHGAEAAFRFHASDFTGDFVVLADSLDVVWKTQHYDHDWGFGECAWHVDLAFGRRDRRWITVDALQSRLSGPAEWRLLGQDRWNAYFEVRPEGGERFEVGLQGIEYLESPARAFVGRASFLAPDLSQPLAQEVDADWELRVDGAQVLLRAFFADASLCTE